MPDMRSLPAFIISFILGFYSFGQHSGIFPQPDKITYSGSDYAVPGFIRYHQSEEVGKAIGILSAQFRIHQRIEWQVVKYTEKADIEFISLPELKKEVYKLTVDSTGIKLFYGSYSGLIYGLQTFEQHIRNIDGAGMTTIAGCIIEDEPAFSYRGMHLDCARHFFNIREITELLDQMAALKLNRFHWHLTDDQGWRLEIKRYPKLTEVGAWRDSTLVGHFSNTPVVYKKERYGGFYTQDEAKYIVQYAAERGITVIPEIEMPGHARAALAAYPELGCMGEQLPVAGTWGVFDDIFCSKPETREFLKNVLDEVMAVFPSEVIHIGGDEAPKVRWDVCPHCAKVKSENGLKDAHELQSYFIQDIENHVRKRGKKIIGWDEILEGGLAKNAQVMSWRGEEGGIAAAKLGHEVVMTPTAFCYFDYYQSGKPNEPLSIGGFLPLEKVYSFDPVPESLTEKEKKFILGAQANLWTEYISDINHVYYMLFPRLIAMSEVLWTKKENRSSYSDFVFSMTTEYLPRLYRSNAIYSSAFLDPKLVPVPTENGLDYKIEPPFHYINFSVSGGESGEISLKRTAIPADMEFVVSSYYEDHGIDHRTLDSIHYRFRSHSLVGIPVEFITPPDPKYNNHGNLALTDGVVGARPWKGDQWLGFSKDTVQFVIDLETEKTLGTLELGTLNDPGSWIYSPKRMIVEGSKDGKTFDKLTDQNIDRELISAEFKSKARFVKITLINDELIPAGLPGAGTTPWTFIDELIFR